MTNTTPQNTPNEQTVVKQKILSIVAALNNIDDERDQIKLVIESLKTEHGIEPKIARKAAKIIHKDNAQEIKDELDALTDLLEKLN